MYEKADPKQHTLAKYFMELSLHCADFSSLDPSYLAACSLCLSFKLLKGIEWVYIFFFLQYLSIFKILFFQESHNGVLYDL